MKRNLFLSIILLLTGCFWLNAQESNLKSFKSKSGITLGEYYKKYHSRKPSIERTTDLLMDASKDNLQTKTTKNLSMPDKFWFPGEFEEVQAILITWPYLHADKDTMYAVEPVNDSMAYFQSWTGRITLTKYVSIIDTSSESRLPIIFARLASAIQKGNAEVWINICNASDSLILKDFMYKNGYTLEKYKFFVNPGNSFWYRDCGPVAFYHGDNDDVAFLDFEYYGGRPADDEIPIRIGEKMNIPVYTTSIEFEGGNILVDGVGTLFTSDQIYSANEDIYGKFVIQNGSGGFLQKTPLTKTQIDDSLTYLMGLNRLEVLPSLKYDGGTGHIDLYAAMWDESNFVFTIYPDELSRLTDYTISSENIDSILSLHSIHQQTYKGKNIPLPKRDDDTWYTNDTNYAIYTRTYSNSTFVNNVIIQPIFSDTSWGAREWDLKALALMEERFPGYEIIPIDIRGYKRDLWGTGFDGSGGAIHCITKQIPAENPVRILHNSIQGYANDYNEEFPIEATIKNKSGIASATFYWRLKGTDNWNSISMDKGDNNSYTALFEREAIENVDTIEYYISAISNNGKTITKPFTAPKGYYTFYYGPDATEEINDDAYTRMETITPVPNEPENPDFVGINSLEKENILLGDFYPNPSSDYARIVISDMAQKDVQIKVVNSLGKIVYTGSCTPYTDKVMFELKTSSFASGMYVVIFSDNSGKSTVKKLIVQ